MFDRIKQLCKENGTNISALCKEITGSTGNYNTWKKNRFTNEHITKIAERFQVTTDYLLGRTNHPNVEFIPADPEKVKAENERIEQQRKESYQQIFDAMGTAAHRVEQPIDPVVVNLIGDVQDLSKEDAAKVRDYVQLLKLRRTQLTQEPPPE